MTGPHWGNRYRDGGWGSRRNDRRRHRRIRIAPTQLRAVPSTLHCRQRRLLSRGGLFCLEPQGSGRCWRAGRRRQPAGQTADSFAATSAETRSGFIEQSARRAIHGMLRGVRSRIRRACHAASSSARIASARAARSPGRGAEGGVCRTEGNRKREAIWDAPDLRASHPCGAPARPAAALPKPGKSGCGGASQGSRLGSTVAPLQKTLRSSIEFASQLPGKSNGRQCLRKS
jgi:hypothetical protein